jgi:hypothetical protein
VWVSGTGSQRQHYRLTPVTGSPKSLMCLFMVNISVTSAFILRFLESTGALRLGAALSCCKDCLFSHILGFFVLSLTVSLFTGSRLNITHTDGGLSQIPRSRSLLGQQASMHVVIAFGL